MSDSTLVQILSVLLISSFVTYGVAIIILISTIKRLRKGQQQWRKIALENAQHLSGK